MSTGCSGTNAVRYGTARGEWFLNAVSRLFKVFRISVLYLVPLDCGITVWRSHQNPSKSAQVVSARNLELSARINHNINHQVRRVRHHETVYWYALSDLTGNKFLTRILIIAMQVPKEPSESSLKV